MRFPPQLERCLAFGALAAAACLAWFPSLRPRVPVADDFHYLRILDQDIADGFIGYFQAMGVWRWWGSTLLSVWMHLHPYAYPVAALLTHVGAVWLFYLTCRRIVGRDSTAFGAALLVAAMPVGYQAIMWASAHHYVLATLLFWLMLWILTKYGEIPARRRFVFLSTFCLTLSAALVHEALVFSALFSPVFLWLPGGGGWREAWRKLRIFYGGLGPIIGALLYIALYFATLSELTTKRPGVFNVPTIFSVYYHQIFQAEIFAAWLSPIVRSAAFSEWSGFSTALAGILAGGLAAAGWARSRRLRGISNPAFDSRRALTLFASLLFGASLVYAAHGGFSRDSRKQYPLIYLIVLVLAHGWEHWLPPRWKSLPAWKLALGSALAVETATAWLMVGLWQWEVRRGDALLQLMIDHGAAGQVRIESDPDIYKSWAFMHESFGFRLTDEWILNHALGHRRPLAEPVRVTKDGRAAQFLYDGANGVWHYTAPASEGPGPPHPEPVRDRW